MEWFEGNLIGNHRFSHEKNGFFPENFPLNQSIDHGFSAEVAFFDIFWGLKFETRLCDGHGRAAQHHARHGTDFLHGLRGDFICPGADATSGHAGEGSHFGGRMGDEFDADS